MKATLNDLLNAKGVNEPLREAVKALINRLEAAEKERDVLKSKVEAMEKQEPVAWARKLGMDLPSPGCVTDLKYRPSDMPESAYMPLYALPGTQGEEK